MELEEARIMARTQMDAHGLQTWSFNFTNSQRNFGMCWPRTTLIQLSAPLVELNSAATVLNTIRHEIAHARAGGLHHHDSVWKRIAINLGCDGQRCYSPRAVIQPEGKYTLECPHCGTQTQRLKKPKSEAACSLCCRAYNHGAWSAEFRVTVTENQ